MAQNWETAQCVIRLDPMYWQNPCIISKHVPTNVIRTTLVVWVIQPIGWILSSATGTSQQSTGRAVVNKNRLREGNKELQSNKMCNN